MKEDYVHTQYPINNPSGDHWVLTFMLLFFNFFLKKKTKNKNKHTHTTSY